MNEPTMNESEQRIKQLQVLKDIALKVIDFISQFEDELVRIWNRPKFVLNSNYITTLDCGAWQLKTAPVADGRNFANLLI